MAAAEHIRVLAPERLPARLPCERIPLQAGARMGYKPNVVQLGDGQLLLANFHTHYEPYDDGSMCEHLVLHRSDDGGRSWTAKHHDHLWGREPYLNRFRDDVVLITTHFLSADVRNDTGATTVWLHRSGDGGVTWSSDHIGVDRIPDDVDMTYTTRNIVELPDGSYLMGVGCGHGRDYRFRSTDRGVSWEVERMTVSGYDADGYPHSFLQEGVFFRTRAGRLLLLARCEPRQMRFDAAVAGIPEIDAELSDSDHYDTEAVFESHDAGLTWEPVNGFPILGCMYPSVCDLDGGRYLLTYTQRVPLADRHMGVYAVVMEEREDGTFHVDPARDVVVVDEKTPDVYDSGGGFGNTLRLVDGTLVTPYSYLDADPEIDALMRSGDYRTREVFEFYRERALPYYRAWVSAIRWEDVRDKEAIAARHCFMGFTGVLNRSGPVTEVCRWRLPASIAPA